MPIPRLKGLAHLGDLLRTWWSYTCAVAAMHRDGVAALDRLLPGPRPRSPLSRLRRLVARASLPPVPTWWLWPVWAYLSRLLAIPTFKAARDPSVAEIERSYRELKHAAEDRPPEFDPLTADPALRAQAELVAWAFHTWLDLELRPYEKAALARYGQTDAALVEFLEYAGCAVQAPSRAMLALYLPIFARVAVNRHDRRLGRKGLLAALRAKARLVRGFFAVGSRVAEAVRRFAWTCADWRERQELQGIQRGVEERLRREARRQAAVLFAAAIENVRSSTGWLAYRQACEQLLTVSRQLRCRAICALGRYPGGRHNRAARAAWRKWKRSHEDRMVQAFAELDRN